MSAHLQGPTGDGVAWAVPISAAWIVVGWWIGRKHRRAAEAAADARATGAVGAWHLFRPAGRSRVDATRMGAEVMGPIAILAACHPSLTASVLGRRRACSTGQ
jgi:cbb3-type cytochrome oxidase subunit 3